MADDKNVDPWPMPRYRSGEYKQVHALGVISLNFNQFQFIFFRLFSHHLERLGVPIQIAWNLYKQLQEHKQPIVTKYIFSILETDAAVRSHIDHAYKLFDVAVTNRNHITHSDLDESSDQGISLMAGVNKHWERINKIEIDLSRLREIADDMFTGWEYTWAIWAYLHQRDTSSLHPVLRMVLPGALPEKPVPPKSLNPKQYPRTQPAQNSQPPASAE